jgi:hypothetical protein
MPKHPVIEKHDLNDVLEVQKIRELIKGHTLSLDFFETMLKLINKNINQQVVSDCLSEISSPNDTSEDEMSELESDSDEDCHTLFHQDKRWSQSAEL